MVGEVAEDVGESSWCVWKLVLEGVVVTLLENTARKRLLDKVLNWLKFRRRTSDPYNHRVAITKSGREVATLSILCFLHEEADDKGIFPSSKWNRNQNKQLT